MDYLGPEKHLQLIRGPGLAKRLGQRSIWKFCFDGCVAVRWDGYLRFKGIKCTASELITEVDYWRQPRLHNDSSSRNKRDPGPMIDVEVRSLAIILETFSPDTGTILSKLAMETVLGVCSCQ